MDRMAMAFTAVYVKSSNGYLGFVEELPGVNAEGRTLDEARANLVSLTEIAFDEERRSALELVAGREVVRESFRVPVAQPRDYADLSFE